MSVSVPTKTDGSVGRPKSDSRPATDLDTQVSAAEHEAIKTSLIEVCTDHNAHLEDATNPHATTLQQAYSAGRDIKTGAGPVEVDSATPFSPAFALTASSGAIPGLMLAPLGLFGPTDIAVSPDAQMVPDENGRSVQIIAGTSGPAASGAPFGGTLELDAGGLNGPGTTGGNVKIGRGNAKEITSGAEGTGSSWTHEGDLTVVGPGGAATRFQITDTQALIRIEGEIAMETPASFVVRVDGDAHFRVSSGLLELLGDSQVSGTLTRTTNPRKLTASDTLTVNDQVVFVSTAAGPVTLTLPHPATCYEPILIVKTSTDANAITISTPSGQINGAASPQVLPDSTSTLRPKWSIATDGTNTWA